jgi:hypothetical protein
VARIGARGCRFLVFGRLLAAGFQTLSQLDLPPSLAEICDPVDATRFRVDLSSTQLRGGGEYGRD